MPGGNDNREVDTTTVTTATYGNIDISPDEARKPLWLNGQAPADKQLYCFAT